MNQFDLEYLIRFLEDQAKQECGAALSITPKVARALADELRTSRDRHRMLVKLRDAFRKTHESGEEMNALIDQLDQIEGDDTADAFRIDGS